MGPEGVLALHALVEEQGHQLPVLLALTPGDLVHHEVAHLADEPRGNRALQSRSHAVRDARLLGPVRCHVGVQPVDRSLEDRALLRVERAGVLVDRPNLWNASHTNLPMAELVGSLAYQ